MLRRDSEDWCINTALRQYKSRRKKWGLLPNEKQDYKVKKKCIWSGRREVNYFIYLPKGMIICNYIVPDSFLFRFHLKTFNKRCIAISSHSISTRYFIIRKLYGAFGGVTTAWIGITAMCLFQAQESRAVKSYQHMLHQPILGQMNITSNGSPLQLYRYLLNTTD